MKPVFSRIRQKAADALMIGAGSFFYALSVDMFSAPNNIAPGGVTGIATLLNFLWGLPIGTMILVINIPLLLAAGFRLGREFTLRSLLGIVVSSVTIDLLEGLIPPFLGDKLLVALFGGALAGLGLGLILSRGATTGGSEIVARLLERRWPNVPIGRLILLVDAVVIALAALVYRQLESALYATVLVFVSSTVTDRIVYGGQRGKLALVMTAQPEKLTAAITDTLARGVTLLPATGGFSHQPRQMLLCAVSRSEVFRLRQIVQQTDPAAFFILLSTDEVVGRWRKGRQ